MKKVISILFSILLFSNNIYSQTKINIWSSPTKVGKTTTKKVSEKKLPTVFQSLTPDGSTEIYQKLDVQTIQIETSTGKSYSYKPITYHAEKTNSVVTYSDKNGWSGFYNSKGGTSYTMISNKVNLDKKDTSDVEETCNYVIPPTENTKPQRTPIMSSTNLTNTEYYNRLYPIKKLCTIYFEVSYRAYQSFNSDESQVIAYLNNFFLPVKNSYAKEGIAFRLNKIYINTTPDPWTLGDIHATLNNFRNRTNSNLPTNPNSHFKMLFDLVGYVGVPYGVGYLGANGTANGFSTSSPELYTTTSQSVVNLSRFGATTPTLPSPSVTAISYNDAIVTGIHELGHNLGSAHTHWCGWLDNQGQPQYMLDSCSMAEKILGQTCLDEPGLPEIRPSKSPTIMSYCHNVKTTIPTGSYIPPQWELYLPNTARNTGGMMENGFGKYPRHAIKSNLDLSPQISQLSSGTTPTVTSYESFTSISQNSVDFGGVVTDTGSSPFLVRGVIWSTSGINPTIENNLGYKFSDYGSLGSFNVTIKNLIAGTTYNVRTFASNTSGVSYGEVRTFTTLVPSLPTVQTILYEPQLCIPNNLIYCPTNTTAHSGGQLVTSGGAIIKERGVLYSTSSTNLVYGSAQKVSDTLDIAGTYVLKINNLLPSTLYFFKAFIRTDAGIGYGGLRQLTTYSSDSVTFGTTSLNAVTESKAQFIVAFNSSGNSPITKRGICLSTSSSPTIEDSVVTYSDGMEPISPVVRGLSQTTHYYWRAFAVNSEGVFYSPLKEFTTKQWNIEFMNFSNGSVGSTMDIKYNHTFSQFAQNYQLMLKGVGILWSKSNPQPVWSNKTWFRQYPGTPTNSDTLSYFLSYGSSCPTSTNCLPPGTKVYYRHYYIDTWNEYNYSDTLSFIVPTGPIVETLETLFESPFSFKVRANVINDNGIPILERGVRYRSGVFYPDNNSPKITADGTLGQYIITIPAFPNTVYLSQAYANNGTTGFGTVRAYRTPDAVPQVIVESAKSVTKTSATLVGSIKNDWDLPITERGFLIGDSADILINNSTIVNVQSQLDTFETNLSGLITGKKYYYRSFALNSYGYGYSLVKSFIAAELPQITTIEASDITINSFISGGNVTSDGGSEVTARGVVYSSAYSFPLLTSASVGVTSDNGGAGQYTSQVLNLNFGTRYFVRAYATNAIGTSYGSVDTVTTLSTLPTLRTIPPYDNTLNSVKSGGQVFSEGYSPITARGVVCRVGNFIPTVQQNNGISVDGLGTNGLGIFNSTITGLQSGTLYTIRAYATNSYGTSYGEPCTVEYPCFKFQTAASLPVVVTHSPTNVSSTTADFNGFLTSSGGVGLLQKGFIYSTSQNKISGSNPLDSIGINKIFTTSSAGGAYSLSVSDLLPSTQYYVRAYATNNGGTGYGIVRTFSTTTLPISIITSSATSITTSTAISGGSLTTTSSQITERGVCWSTAPNPTISNQRLTDPQNISGDYAITLTNLNANTKYYTRAYVRTGSTITYGQQVIFTTLATISNIVLTNITSSSVNFSSTVGGGSEPLVNRGVCYSLNPNVSINDNITLNGTTIGNFSGSIGVLEPLTTYFIRAYAQNAGGVSYSPEISFTTLVAPVPVVTTSESFCPLNHNSIKVGGGITSIGGSNVIQKGFVWSSSNFLPRVETDSKNELGVGTSGETFESIITGLNELETYFVRAYATNSYGTSYGETRQIPTLQNSTDCLVSELNAGLVVNKWFTSFIPNPSCQSYTIKLSKYSNSNAQTPPTINSTPITSSTRYTNLVPLCSETSLIQKILNPPPLAEQTTSRWFSIDVNCNGCGNGGQETITKYFFYQLCLQCQ